MITPRRIEWAIFSFDPYIEIYPALLQKTWDIIGNPIVSIYRASALLGRVPSPWQNVNVTFIPKIGKDNYTSSKAFRPISMSSFLLRGMERLIERYIREMFDISGQLHGSQHAFQKGKSTETALHEIVDNDTMGHRRCIR